MSLSSWGQFSQDCSDSKTGGLHIENPSVLDTPGQLVTTPHEINENYMIRFVLHYFENCLVAGRRED